MVLKLRCCFSSKCWWLITTIYANITLHNKEIYAFSLKMNLFAKEIFEEPYVAQK